MFSTCVFISVTNPAATGSVTDENITEMPDPLAALITVCAEEVEIGTIASGFIATNFLAINTAFAIAPCAFLSIISIFLPAS